MTDTATTGEMLDDLNALDVPDLKDPKLYIEENNNSLITVLSGFSIMLQTYLSDITPYTENVAPNLKQNVILCGIDMVRNVFSETVIYTRNVLTACQTTRHAMSLFFEFVSQITDGQFKHIQLSVRDTMLFVYKQTIFRLHDEKRAGFVATSSEREQYKCMTYYTKILIAVCNEFITRDSADNVDGKSTSKSMSESTSKSMSKSMNKLSANIHNFDEHISKLFVFECVCTASMMESLNNVTECLLKKNVSYDVVFDVLTRVTTFYRHKINRGILPDVVVKRVNQNCTRVSSIHDVLHEPELIILELTRI